MSVTCAKRRAKPVLELVPSESTPAPTLVMADLVLAEDTTVVGRVTYGSAELLEQVLEHNPGQHRLLSSRSGWRNLGAEHSRSCASIVGDGSRRADPLQASASRFRRGNTAVDRPPSRRFLSACVRQSFARCAVADIHGYSVMLPFAEFCRLPRPPNTWEIAGLFRSHASRSWAYRRLLVLSADCRRCRCGRSIHVARWRT